MRYDTQNLNPTHLELFYLGVQAFAVAFAVGFVVLGLPGNGRGNKL